MDIPLLIAVITASVTLIGWLVNHVLNGRRERHNHRLAASLKYVERQLEELYGPLAFYIMEGRGTFRDLLGTLGRRTVFENDEPLPEGELKIWQFWVENDFFPRNEKIQQLLMTKTHLIEGDAIPDSFFKFLEHCNSWKMSHLRWQKEAAEYPWRAKSNWPIDFENDVIKTFNLLKARHNKFLMKYTDIKS